MSSEESITESVKQTLKERVANPLWGYIILSWVGFNWKSIAIMCLSEASVVTRIQQITSTEDFYLKTLCYPVVLGFILATFFPYISNLVTLLQVKATAWRVRQKVEAENLEESARLASKLKIEAQKNKIEEEVLKIEVLKKEREQLQNDITDSNARADAASGFAPIFPDTCYHLTHYWPAAADIPVASDNPVHYADAIRYNA
ncbi:hypothetical protein ACUOGM_21185, partial [Escherichia coli]